MPGREVRAAGRRMAARRSDVTPGRPMKCGEGTVKIARIPDVQRALALFSSPPRLIIGRLFLPGLRPRGMVRTAWRNRERMERRRPRARKGEGFPWPFA